MLCQLEAIQHSGWAQGLWLSSTSCSPSLNDILLHLSPRTRSPGLRSQHFLFGNMCCHCCSLSHVWLFGSLWSTACQASLSPTISQSLPTLTPIESVMPSNHLILCRPLLLLPSTFPSLRVFSNELDLYIRWSKYRSFSISPSNEYSRLPLQRHFWVSASSSIKQW